MRIFGHPPPWKMNASNYCHNEDDLKNEDNLINEDELKNEDDIKIEDELKN